jgi:hypothetical protein
MVETLLIFGFSLALFVYWFRYTVLLLLSQDPIQAHGPVMDQLSLARTCEALQRTQNEAALDRLQQALDGDYRMLSYLLDHAAGMEMRPLEQLLLRVDYRVQRMWFRLARRASGAYAHKALAEMAGVLNHIARKMSERVTAPTNA